MFSKILRGTVLATFAVGATVAQADVFDNASPSQVYWNSFEFGSVNVNLDNTLGKDYRGVGGEFYGYYGTKDAKSDFFRFFCIELGQWATSEAQYWRSVLNETSDEAKQLSYLFSRYYPNALGKNDWSLNGQEAKFGNFYKPYGGTNTNQVDPNYAVKSGAMQLAVWEIMFEQNENANGLNLTTGNFRDLEDNAGRTLANEWLSDVWSNYKNTGVTSWRFYKFESPDPNSTNPDGAQNYIAADFGSFDIPLPGTLALLGIGLAGLGLARRKS